MSDSRKKSLLFIPDISGFTNFIKSTEINHSRHIIAELLELILDANEIGLTAAEIEGDAILFYKDTNLPSMEKIFDQVRKMFMEFHTHLKLYETRRICNCGACSSANNLTLKFVVHVAEFDIIKVKNFRKPYGYEVIKAHRLLKNTVNHNEYLLITNSSYPESKLDNIKATDWLNFEQASTFYDDFGDVDFSYSHLSSLHKNIVTPDPLPLMVRTESDLKVEVVIGRPPLEILEALTDFRMRKLWQEGVTEIIYDENEINRIGTQHTCIIGNQNLHFETVRIERNDDEQVFAERILNPPFKLAKDIVAIYTLTKNGKGTLVEVEYQIKPIKFFGKFFASLIRKNLSVVAPKALGSLKAFVEQQ